ncbi:Holliday junction branch migration protein RuvA [Candidatus Oleimmundimicrobium sp.]|uniref:Holliday junction branch migration protein RuvA n=1 Tax=Candidatus Oleimmundimicrobium sp. TaxID=3060597 RepID=UPI00271BB287|nr:Holliday junction branch migration protein RuvA [Candidatus Oleimmundimicrobium sp.]MDO8886707.1 Holliday junction branch migration protein RuvA [Candidatus Oleimmundimicrobium sp.]
MIAYLEGKIKEKGTDKIVVDVNGIGFEVFVSSNSLRNLPEKGEIAGVHTYLHVREDILQIFGFNSLEEKEMFLNLLSVSKIGPKIALSILSALSLDSLRKAIIMGDLEMITAIPGIGKKGAQRLILELKEKLELPDFFENIPEQVNNSAYIEARDALVNLGYSTMEAAKALEGCLNKNNLSAEEMIKFALKKLAKC